MNACLYSNINTPKSVFFKMPHEVEVPRNSGWLGDAFRRDLVRGPDFTSEGSRPRSQVRPEGLIESQIIIKSAQKCRGTYNMYNNFEGARGLGSELPVGVWGQSPLHWILNEAEEASLSMRIVPTSKAVHRHICRIGSPYWNAIQVGSRIRLGIQFVKMELKLADWIWATEYVCLLQMTYITERCSVGI